MAWAISWLDAPSRRRSGRQCPWNRGGSSPGEAFRAPTPPSHADIKGRPPTEKNYHKTDEGWRRILPVGWDTILEPIRCAHPLLYIFSCAQVHLQILSPNGTQLNRRSMFAAAVSPGWRFFCWALLHYPGSRGPMNIHQHCCWTILLTNKE